MLFIYEYLYYIIVINRLQIYFVCMRNKIVIYKTENTHKTDFISLLKLTYTL